MVAIWRLSLKAPHPLYPHPKDVEGAVSAPERLNNAPLVSYHGVAIWWLCVASSASNDAVAEPQVSQIGTVAEPQVIQMDHLNPRARERNRSPEANPPRTWAIVAHLPPQRALLGQQSSMTFAKIQVSKI